MTLVSRMIISFYIQIFGWTRLSTGGGTKTQRYQTSVTKFPPHTKHRLTALSKSSTTQLRAEGGSQLGGATAAGASTSIASPLVSGWAAGSRGCGGGRNALREHDIHVRTMGVESMKDVMEHRAVGGNGNTLISVVFVKLHASDARGVWRDGLIFGAYGQVE